MNGVLFILSAFSNFLNNNKMLIETRVWKTKNKFYFQVKKNFSLKYIQIMNLFMKRNMRFIIFPSTDIFQIISTSLYNFSENN